ncbi:NADH-quinone oxidoreductase subunit 5 family protein [Pontibacter chitinilyticus]|uniref:NADH-quinone oxidoreductase subunit 5 family protein n=1 Tax=Pontibacter chitinilyticus TaxID=2674989 RepID=UPI00321AD097
MAATIGILALVIGAPLAASAAIYLFRSKGHVLGIMGALLSLAGAAWVLAAVQRGQRVALQMPGLPQFPFRLQADPAAALLAVVVGTVALFIFLYAYGYMAPEKGKTWFWAGMSLFLAAMQLLVLSGDWVLFVTGWELMGFASYLLIGTWHWEEDARRGSAKAFLLTRFTDLGLYLGVFIILIHTGSSYISGAAQPAVPLLGALALLLAVMGKSAQVPFQSWLSGAMAGPTPVSALLHSATMVAAGAILLLRAFPLLPAAALPFIGAVGGGTILLTGLTALVSKDLKQLLAASTSSQLGFMLLAIAAGFPAAAFGHLLAHAFMKSSLFLGAGVFQHGYDGTAFEKLRGAGKRLRPTALLFAVAGVALAGIPPLIGYYSKDGIVAAGYQSGGLGLYFGVALLGAFFTAAYMARAVRLLYTGTAAKPEVERLRRMQLGLVALVVVVAFGGIFLERVALFAGYEIPTAGIAKIGGLAAALAGLAVGWYIRSARVFGGATGFLQKNYPVLGGYSALVAAPAMQVAYWCAAFDRQLHAFVLKAGAAANVFSQLAKTIDSAFRDVTWITGTESLSLGRYLRRLDDEGLEAGVSGVAASVKKLGKQARQLQSGLVHRELLWSVAGVAVLLLLWLVSMYD